MSRGFAAIVKADVCEEAFVPLEEGGLDEGWGEFHGRTLRSGEEGRKKL